MTEIAEVERIQTAMSGLTLPFPVGGFAPGLETALLPAVS